MEKDLHIVGFRVGRETYGVPIMSIREIVRVPEITTVPDAPEYIEGVINLRGKIVSVMDLRKRFGGKNVQPSAKNRILVCEISGKLVGLIVDSASEVLKIPRSDVDGPPPLVQEGSLQCITGVARLKNRIIIVVDLAKLLAAGTQVSSSTTETRTNEARAEKPVAPQLGAALGAKAGTSK